jgi:tRNA 2-thiouridine synthesizing protein A
MSNHDQDPARLDATGLTCPLPVLRTRKALAGLAVGSLLEVRATDPAAVKDMAAFCEATGHALVESSAADGVYRFLLRKAG